MWDELVGLLADFGSAVLTGVDASGYPFSLRCQPEPDGVAQVLRVRVPQYANIQPGPAGLKAARRPLPTPPESDSTDRLVRNPGVGPR